MQHQVGPSDVSKRESAGTAALGVQLARALPPGLGLAAVTEALGTIYAAARTPQDAMPHLMRGVEEALGGPALEVAAEAVWTRLRASVPGSLLPSERPSLEAEVRRLAHQYARVARALAGKRGTRRRRWGALLRLIGLRRSTRARLVRTGEPALRRAFADETAAVRMWVAEQRADHSDAPHPFDARAHALAIRLVRGAVQLPACMSDFRAALEATDPRLGSREVEVAREIEALVEIDHMAQRCMLEACGRHLLGGLWKPGCREARRRHAVATLDVARAQSRSDRTRARAFTAGAALLVLDAADPTPQRDLAATTTDLRALLRGARVPGALRAGAGRAVARAYEAGVALEELEQLMCDAERQPKRRPAIKSRAAVRESGIVDGPRQEAGLYLGTDGKSIELGGSRLQYRTSRSAPLRPVTLRNDVGRLLMWLATGNRGRPASVERWAAGALRKALEGSVLEVRGAGSKLQLEPRPAHVSKSLLAAWRAAQA